MLLNKKKKINKKSSLTLHVKYWIYCKRNLHRKLYLDKRRRFSQKFLSEFFLITNAEEWWKIHNFWKLWKFVLESLFIDFFFIKRSELMCSHFRQNFTLYGRYLIFLRNNLFIYIFKQIFVLNLSIDAENILSNYCYCLITCIFNYERVNFYIFLDLIKIELILDNLGILFHMNFFNSTCRVNMLYL